MPILVQSCWLGSEFHSRKHKKVISQQALVINKTHYMIPLAWHDPVAISLGVSKQTLQYLQQTPSPVESSLTLDPCLPLLQDVVNEVLQEIGLDAWFPLFRCIPRLRSSCLIVTSCIDSAFPTSSWGLWWANWPWKLVEISRAFPPARRPWEWWDDQIQQEASGKDETIWNASIKNWDSCCLQSFVQSKSWKELLVYMAWLMATIVATAGKRTRAVLCKLNRIFTPKCQQPTATEVGSFIIWRCPGMRLEEENIKEI